MTRAIPVRVRGPAKRRALNDWQRGFRDALADWEDASDPDVADIARALRDALETPEGFEILARGLRTVRVGKGLLELSRGLGSVLQELGEGRRR